MHGAPGVGKTYLVALRAQQLQRAGREVVYWRVSDLLQRFLELNRKGEGEGRLLQKLYKAEVLIMDDMGAEKATEYVGMMLGKIIDARYNEELTTLITSNLDLESLAKKYDATDPCGVQGQRIADRIRALCKVVKIGGSSRRESK